MNATFAHPRPAVRNKSYYGWTVVAVMASANAVSMAMATLNFGLFIKPMGDELGIGRSMFGWATSAGQVATSAASPFMGRLVDRFGSRILLPAAALITAGAMAGLAFINTGWQMLPLFALMGVVGLTSPGPILTYVPVMKWFVRDRGRAVAFVGLGLPVGALLFVPLTQLLIGWRGWRETWIILGVLGAGVIVPLALTFVRRQPEDLGLRPDGATEDPSVSHAVQDERSWSVRQAVRSRAFWSLVIAVSAASVATSTMAVHRIAAFQDRGVDPGLISIATALDAVCAGLSSFALGYLAPRLPARFLGGAGIAALAVAGVLTIFAGSAPLVFLSMMLFGCGIGGYIFLQTFVWADYFGRGHLGAIRGIVMPVTLIVGGIGAPLAGYVRDWTGSYDPVWWPAVGLLACAAVLTLFTKRPSPLPGR